MAAALAAGVFFQANPTAAPVPLAVAGIGIVVLALRTTEIRRNGPMRLASSYVLAVRLFRSPAVRVVGLLSVAYGLLFLVIGNAFVPLYLVSLVSVPAVLVGLGLSLRSVVVLLGSITFGGVAARIGIVAPVVSLTLVGAVGVGAVPLIGVVPGIFLLAMLLQGAGIAYSAAAANVLVARASRPGERALAIAATNLGSRATLVVIPPVLGTIYEGAAPAIAFLVGAVLVIVTAAAAWALRPRHQLIEGYPAL
jgi:hypothetical protein